MYHSPNKTSDSAYQYSYKIPPSTPNQNQKTHINYQSKNNNIKSLPEEEISKINLNHRKHKKKSLLSQITLQNFPQSSSHSKQQNVPSKSDTFHTYYKAKIFDNRERKFTQLQHISQQFGPGRSIETLQTRAILYKCTDRKICNEPYKYKSDQLNHLNSIKNQVVFQSDCNDSFQPKKSMIQRPKRPFSVADLLTKSSNSKQKNPKTKMIIQIQQQNNITNRSGSQQISDFQYKSKFDPLQRSKVKGVVSSLTRINTFLDNKFQRNKSKSLHNQMESTPNEQTQNNQDIVKKDFQKLSERLIYEQDRVQFTQFLNSQWVKEMIESRSLKTDSVPQFHKSIKSTVIDLDQSNQIYDILLVRQQYKNQKKQQTVNEENSTFSQEAPIKSVSKYLKNKFENQMIVHDYSKQINFLDKAFEKISKKQEQDQLAGYDMFYDIKVRRRKFINHIRSIVKRSQQLHMSVQEIIDKRIYSSMAFQAQGSYSLFFHAKKGNDVEIIQQLKKNPSLIYEFDEQGRTVLHVAIIKQKISTVQILIQMDASLHQKDFYNNNALTLALNTKNRTLIQYICGVFYPCDQEYISVMVQLRSCGWSSLKQSIKRNKILNLKKRIKNDHLKEYFNHLLDIIDQK